MKQIPLYIIIIILLVLCYVLFTTNKKINDISNEVHKTKIELLESHILHVNMTKNIYLEINESHLKAINLLNEKIDEIDNISRNNNVIVNRLHREVNNTKSNYDSLAADTKKRYNEAISELFTTSTGLLEIFSKEADRSTEAAISYYAMIQEQKKIIDEHNAKLNKDKKD